MKEIMRLSRLLFVFVFMFLSLFTFSQTTTRGKVQVVVQEASGSPANAATVALLRKKDSVVVKTEFSDSQGKADLEGIRSGSYLLKISLLGHDIFYSEGFQINDAEPIKNFGKVLLLANAASLSAVTVEAKKPFIERKLDRFVVNVESSIVSAGSTALEVLERAPGVVIDQNDRISVKGKQGVIIMIDGKPSPMSGADLANFLRGLPSSAIDKIEIITNPSSKYDAAGNAGIINIILKKDQRLGTNGTLTLSYGQGVFSKTSEGISLNHRNKKVNIFGSYNFSYRKSFNHLELFRRFFKNNSFDGAYDQDNNFVAPLFSHVGRAGVDYTINKKTVIGVLFSANRTNINRTGNNTSAVYDASNSLNSFFSTGSDTRDKLYSTAGNINLKHKFDTTGKELSVDLDYAKFGNSSLQNFATQYYKPNGTTAAPDYLLLGDQLGTLTIQSVKADYVHPLGNKSKVEAGLKSSFVHADSRVAFYDKSSGTPIYVASQSNHFLYDENINAGYLNVSKEYKKLNVQLGLRVEQTNIRGNQLVTGQKFDSSYINLFPSAFLNYKLNTKNELGVSMSRRLDRPSYSQLNPFRFFLDPSTYREGNPYLRPQYSYSFELIHTYNSKLITTLSYTITRDVITNIISPVDGVDKVTVQTDRNLAEFEQYSVNVSAPFKITKWWSTVNNLNVFYGHYRGNIANTSLNNGQPSFNVNSSNSFMLKKGWTAELSGLYFARSIYGFMNVKPQWQLSAGVQKPIFNKKVVARLNVTDAFWTMVNQADINFRDYKETFQLRRETRVVTLSFSYRFGNMKVAQARRRDTGVEDEKRRAN